MIKKDANKTLQNFQFFDLFIYLIKWILLSVIIAILVASLSVFFLFSLDFVTNFRENNKWIISFLGIAGFASSYIYLKYGSEISKGNNLLFEEFHNPKQKIPFKMMPFILFSTILSHLFGASVGREGTAVQMGAAISDQFTQLLKLDKIDRKILIIMGISAGFASVFGTPLAASVFALEVLLVRKIKYEAILPSFLVAYLADFICKFWKVEHTKYHIDLIPLFSLQNFLYAILVGIIFGLVALSFSKITHYLSDLFKKRIKFTPLITLLGGFILSTFVFFTSTKFIGLGITIIIDSFVNQQNIYDFAIKLLITSFSIAVGFKGGEVTPLFFIGATLGSAMSILIPLPISLLAAMGFVSVFAGATNTPLACILMGIELFSLESAIYISISCIMAFLFSGHNSIYSSQILNNPKHHKYFFHK